MSAYLSIYIKSKDGYYMPLTTVSRSHPLYRQMDEIVPYGENIALTKSMLDDVYEITNHDIDEIKDLISRYEQKIELISKMEGEVSEKLSHIGDYMDDINELNKEIDGYKGVLSTISFLKTIINEAEDTKYYSNEVLHLDPNDVIYAGIEAGNPNLNKGENE